MNDHQFLIDLIYGAYVFTGLAWAWAWTLYKRVIQRLDLVEVNHLKHLEARLQRLEKVAGIEPPAD